MIVSGEQQRDSAIHIYVSILQTQREASFKGGTGVGLDFPQFLGGARVEGMGREKRVVQTMTVELRLEIRRWIKEKIILNQKEREREQSRILPKFLD